MPSISEEECRYASGVPSFAEMGTWGLSIVLNMEAVAALIARQDFRASIGIRFNYQRDIQRSTPGQTLLGICKEPSRVCPALPSCMVC